jgi:hypothetical protein
MKCRYKKAQYNFQLLHKLKKELDYEVKIISVEYKDEILDYTNPYIYVCSNS